MYYVKKINLKFKNLSIINIDNIKEIISIITEDTSFENGTVHLKFNKNHNIKKLDDIPKLNDGLNFVLTSNSEDNLNKLYVCLKNKLNKLNIDYMLEEQIPYIVLHFNNKLPTEKSLLEIINNHNQIIFSKITDQSYDYVDRPKRINYLYHAKIKIICDLTEYNNILNEILNDLQNKNYGVTFDFC